MRLEDIQPSRYYEGPEDVRYVWYVGLGRNDFVLFHSERQKRDHKIPTAEFVEWAEKQVAPLYVEVLPKEEEGGC